MCSEAIVIKEKQEVIIYFTLMLQYVNDNITFGSITFGSIMLLCQNTS